MQLHTTHTHTLTHEHTVQKVFRCLLFVKKIPKLLVVVSVVCCTQSAPNIITCMMLWASCASCSGGATASAAALSTSRAFRRVRERVSRRRRRLSAVANVYQHTVWCFFFVCGIFFQLIRARTHAKERGLLLSARHDVYVVFGEERKLGGGEGPVAGGGR